MPKPFLPMKIITALAPPSIRRMASMLAGFVLAATAAFVHANGVGQTGRTVHPAKYQSAQQADRDEYECHMRAKGQSAVDRIGATSSSPTAPQPRARQGDQLKTQQQQAARNEQRSVYDRDFSACMDARGYVLR